MRLISFELYADRVMLRLGNGQVLRIWHNKSSGKVVSRLKIDTISNVQHTGIVLGVDDEGRWRYMHNHFEYGCAVIDTAEGFGKEQPIYWAKRQPDCDRNLILRKALNEIIEGRAYDWWSNNCQTFVNRICYNENRSEAIENWTGGVLAALVVIAGINAVRQ